MLIGTAKAIPTLPSAPSPAVSICELMPITRPAASSSGPPELPGLIGASVWITLSIAEAVGGLDLALERRDDPAGQRAVEPERVADRQGGVARPGPWSSRRARGARRAGTPAGSTLSTRQVVVRILADDRGAAADVVLELDGRRRCGGRRPRSRGSW